VPNHAGEAQGTDRDYFVPPPASIGAVESAYTTLTTGAATHSVGKRLMKAAPAPLVAAAVACVVALAAGASAVSGFVLWPAAAAALIGWVTWNEAAFRPRCTYVGRDGMALYACKGRPDTITRSAVLLFRDAAALRTAQTVVYRNGAYQHTTYDFQWTDARGRRLYQVNGQFHAEKQQPPAGDPFHFGAAGEVAWTRALLSRAEEDLRRTGWLEFPLGGGILPGSARWIRVGKGWIEVRLSGKGERLQAADIASVFVHRGEVTIRTHDARVGAFGDKGLYTFPYREMANVHAFLAAVEQLVGIRASG
jgi:hypothetical protein